MRAPETGSWKKRVLAQQQQMRAKLLHSAPPKVGNAVFVPLSTFFFFARIKISQKRARK